MENDVKFIRLAFCDMYGVQKNISIMPDQLEKAFESGISFDASSFPGFCSIERSDLRLIPDRSTVSLLPWRPSHGRVVRFFCDIIRPDGTPFGCDGRALLKSAVERARRKGYKLYIGAEAEFYLFCRDEKGYPTAIPFDEGGYMDIAPADKGENVRRDICLTSEEMGIRPERSYHEAGPGQNEIDFAGSEPVSAADNLTTLKWIVRTAADRSGLYADFSPKPLPDNPGNGLHISISLARVGQSTVSFGERSAFIAGILSHIGEMTAFLNPVHESYSRFGRDRAPGYVSWDTDNRSALIRIPEAETNEIFELRSPDCTCNPYLAYTLLIHAGLDGMEKEMRLPEPSACNLYTDNHLSLDALPQSLEQARIAAQNSQFIRDCLPDSVIRLYTGKNE